MAGRYAIPDSQRPEVSQDRLGEIYSATAAFYDGIVLEHQIRAKDIALQLLGRRRGDIFLEVGVGTGWAFERVIGASGGESAVGLDAAEGMLEVARRRLAHAGAGTTALLLGDATRLPFRDAVFDCLLCTYTLDVLPSLAVPRALHELRRVMRDGGRLVTLNLTAGEGNDAAFTEDWQRRYSLDPEYFSGARPLMAIPLLQEAGFRISDRHYVGHGESWPSEVVLATRTS